MKNYRIAAGLAAVLLVVALFGSCSTVKKSNDPHILADYPPALLGVSRLNIVKRYTSTLLPRDITFIFDAGTNLVKFHHKMLGDNIWVYLTEENRAVMRKAIESYLTAFSDHTLTTEHEKQKGFFGKTDIVMVWGLLGASHEAIPTLRFEYQFITPTRPYFIIATATTDGSDESNSPALRIAVSPLQCKDLLTLIEEHNLDELAKKIKQEYERFADSEGKTSVEEIEHTAHEVDSPIEEAKVPFDTF